ncbi:MAG: prolyl endopeptidase-like protein [Linnemannia gamsii]|nr:MAG: prolyl endopeptidase-like protein [Linnemannia gamsii]
MVNAHPTSLDGKIAYPQVRRTDFEFQQHGTTVADPYRWLEDPHGKETEAFIDAQNELSAQFMNKFDGKTKFNERLTELNDYERISAPYKRGDYYYFYRNTGLQAQNVFYQQDSIDADPRVFLDPNTLEADGTAALSKASFSKSGLLFGYAIAKSGSDWVTIYVMDNKGNKLDDVVEWAKFTDITFTHDDKGFYYGSYEKPTDVDSDKAGTETGVNINKRLYYHKIGTPQSEDVLVFLDTENPLHAAGTEISDDGKYLLLSISRDCENVNMLYVANLEETGSIVPRDHQWTKVVDNFKAYYNYLANDGTVFYFSTNKDAPRDKIIKYDLAKPQEGFTDVVPESEDVLSDATVVNGDKLVLNYMRDVKNVLVVHDLKSGQFINQIDIPVGTVAGITGRRVDKEIFVTFYSYLTPGTIYRYSFETEKEEDRLTIFRESKVKNFDSTLFETKQVFYESKDGTKIPMFITHKKGLVLNSDNPVYLYGYGGFNISIQAGFSPSYIAFVQNLGGVVAVANLRGGAEYGEDWHKAGTVHNKQNVFDDFQYAAKYLIKENYTKPSRISINGGSNGGLLVAACVNQAPELFGAAVADVGVMDMLRFHKFTIGHAWQSDYGFPDDKPEDFQTLLKYSPVHNVRKDVSYPPFALFTSDHDDRVVPLHSFKLIAELQHTAGPVTNNPLVIRIETKAGHGAGKPIAKRIAETTDKIAFIANAIGAKWID